MCFDVLGIVEMNSCGWVGVAVGREIFVDAMRLEKGAVERIARGYQIFKSLGCFLIPMKSNQVTDLLGSHTN